MKKRPIFFAAAFVLVVVLAVVFAFLTPRFPRYVRSASGPPLNDPSYDQVMNPHFREEGVVTNIGKMTVVADGSETRLEIPRMPAGRVEQTNRRYEYHSIAPGERFEDENGTIALDYFAIAYGAIPVEEIEEYSIELPGDYYNGNLEPLSDREMLDRFPAKSDLRLLFGGDFPVVKFGFSTDLKEVKVVGYWLLDPVLKRLLSRGHSRGEMANHQYMESELLMWHTGPVDVVMDLAVGPVETREFAAEAGIVQKFEEAEVKVAALLPGMRHRGHSGSSDSLSIKFAALDEGDDSITSVVIASIPESSMRSFELSFFDSGGKELRTRGQSSSRGLSVIGVLAEPDEIHSIRIKHYPNSKRLVFHFPSLPGLPEQNRSVDNLFGTHIPYIRIRDQHEMVRVLEKLIGLRIQDTSLGMRPATVPFPVTYQALTVEELFEEYLAMREGAGPRVRVDAAAGLIEISDPNPKWMEWINMWWRRLKP